MLRDEFIAWPASESGLIIEATIFMLIQWHFYAYLIAIFNIDSC
jgi:hypothetical protein